MSFVGTGDPQQTARRWVGAHQYQAPRCSAFLPGARIPPPPLRTRPGPWGSHVPPCWPLTSCDPNRRETDPDRGYNTLS